MHIILILAGIGQIALIIGSLAIPRVLGWREDTAQLKPLTRQVFWTYAAYIWSINLAFGLLSACKPAWLLDGSGLARALSGAIALYWGARVGVQFFYFDRSSAPPGFVFKLAEAALVALFIALTIIYALIAAGFR